MARENTLTSFSNGPKFLKGLKDAGSISSTVQAWYLSSDNSTQSFVQIGGYTTDYIKSGSSLVSISLVTDFFWQSVLTGFGVGTSGSFSGSSSGAYKVSDQDFIFDTGTTLFYTPDDIATTISKKLVASVSYLEQDGYYYVKCTSSSSMPSAFVYMDGYYIETPPSSYLLLVGQFTDGSDACMIGIVGNGDTYWLAGDIFLKSFFSVWDDDNSVIQLAPHSYSSATIFSGASPSTTYSSSSSSSTSLTDVLIGVASFLGLVAAAYLMVEYVLPLIGINITLSQLLSVCGIDLLARKNKNALKPKQVLSFSAINDSYLLDQQNHAQLMSSNYLC